jgi:hypothetical protein
MNNPMQPTEKYFVAHGESEKKGERTPPACGIWRPAKYLV